MARAGSQRLDGSHPGPACDLVRDVAGIQAQDPAAAKLGVRVRSKALTAADLEAARSEDRSVLRTWVMRGTLHLIATEDAGIYESLFTEKELAWTRRRLAEAFDIDAKAQDRICKLTEAMLKRDGLIARRDLLDHLAASGITFDRASTGHHLPRLAVLAGVACFGPDRGRETTYVLRSDWIDEPRAVEPGAAAVELARRYISAFGPADERDFAAFTGLGVGTCRKAFEAIVSELDEVRVGGTRMWVARERRSALRKGTVRLLPGFDNHLLAHADREFAIAPADRPAIWPGGGIIRPTVLVDGVVLGAWRTRRVKTGFEVTISPFAELTQSQWKRAEAEAADIGRFEGCDCALVRD